jgi:beta-lactamase regulating signal transducer with metallopeptidase domain
MTSGFSALRSASSSVIIFLVIVTLLLLAAIVVHRSIRQSPAAKHAVMLMTLVTIGFCPMMLVVARFAWVRAQIRLPNPMIFYHSGAFFQNAEQVGSSTHFPFAGALLALWAAGSLVGLVRLILGLHAMSLVRHSAKPPAPESMAPLRRSLAAALGCNLPEILVSEQVGVPVALGCLRSLVLLPACFLKRFNDYQLFQMLVHECAHALRRDTLAGFYQRFLAGVLWFHPLIYIANRFLDRAREEVCDNYVLQFVPSGEYSRTLLLVAQLLSPLPNQWFAPTVIRSAYQLEERVAGLLNPRRSIMIRLTLKKMAVIAAGFIGGALVLSCLSATLEAALAPSAANQAQDQTAEPSSSKDTGKESSVENKRVREINYVGINSISSSEVLDRFKKDKVSLSLESEYDPTKTQKVEVVLKQLEAEHGHRFATVRTKVRNIPPGAVGITFVVSEGPKAF